MDTQQKENWRIDDQLKRRETQRKFCKPVLKDEMPQTLEALSKEQHENTSLHSCSCHSPSFYVYI